MLDHPLPAPTAARGALARGRILPWVLLLLFAGAIGLSWWLLRGKAAHQAAAAASARHGFGGGRFAGNLSQPVSIDTAQRRDIRVTTNAIGSIVAYNTATVHVQVSGVLQRLDYREGQQVRAGQQLAQIDPRAFEAALEQAQGALARDQALLAGAQVDLARYQGLRAKDAIPAQQLDTQKTLAAQLAGTVQVDRAAVAGARLNLQYTHVLSPIAGRAGIKQVDIGNVVTPGDANGIVVITQTRPIALVFAVPSAQLPAITARLRANQPLPVVAFDRVNNKQLATGRVASLDNLIDPTTDTVKVKAVFPNEDDALFPNQAVSVTLQTDVLAGATAVPQAAVQRGAQGYYVYVVNPDGTVTARVVKPGAVDADWMAVEGPVQPGDRVVIDGIDRLRDGAKVEVIATDPRLRAGAAPASAAHAGQGASAGRGGP
ncbi:MAG: efflux RND transporter periplasmic adaptor subunit, partial [Burkholderiales bacterium]|nr:efflux RND transporter periplasmic adaptor subunit [Burkholderiales bacterium]